MSPEDSLLLESRRTCEGGPVPPALVTLQWAGTLNTNHLAGVELKVLPVFLPTHINLPLPGLEEAVAHLGTRHSQAVQARSLDLSKPWIFCPQNEI